MSEYIMSFNRTSGKMIKYSSTSQAEAQGITEYTVIEADSYQQAKTELLDRYKQTNQEDE